MTKQEFIAKLEGAKELTSVVSIDLVLAGLNMLEDTVETPKVASEKVSQALMQKIVGQIERTLHNIDDTSLFDSDSAEFSLDHNNQINLDSVDLDHSYLMSEISESLEDFIEEEEEEEEDED